MRAFLVILVASLLAAAALTAATAQPTPGRGPGAWDLPAPSPPPPSRPPLQATPAPPLARIRAACHTFQPYFAVARFIRMASPRQAPDYPVIVAVGDTADDDPSAMLPLATNGDVGAVHGLAYDAPRGILYAAAYSKRSSAFGPGGTGAVYAVDLGTGTTRTLAQLFGGRDNHDFIRQEDQAAAETVGRTSLGDIELDDSGDTLFVMNLAEGRIFRLRTADGAVLGSFAHGAAGYPWRRSARPFGLGYHHGWLYHGVVNSLEFEGGALEAVLFRSRPDGTGMEELTRIDLRYPRTMPWGAWNRGPAQFPGGGIFSAFDAQPLLADIEFLPGGDLVVGFRDRVTDMIPGLDRANPVHPGSGDLVPVRRDGTSWQAETVPEFYADGTSYDEAAYGGLALLGGFDLVVTSARAVAQANDVGALWFWNANGRVAAAEPIDTFDYVRVPNGTNGLGDVEALCPQAGPPDPGAVPTATSFAATATAGAAETATVVALTPTAVTNATPEHFDRVIRDSCPGENPYAATICYPPLMPALLGFSLDADTVQVFRDTPADAPVYAAAWLSAVGGTWGLAYRAADGALFVSAFHKRLVSFGPGGPGAVYRVDIRTGLVSPLAVLDAGVDFHGPPSGSDRRGRDVAGKTSLGDIDLDEDQSVLFAANLHDRRIYRLDAVSGAVLGSFAQGAAGAEWEADARPFGLGIRGGKVYHGVVNSAETTQRRADLAAVVYESDPDGSNLRQVASFPLTYDRGTVTVPGVLGQPDWQVPLDWQPWTTGEADLMGSKARVALYPQPLLADIQFGANGDMIVGLRDRFTDTSLGNQIQIGGTIIKPGLGLGDVLRLPFNGDTWDEPTDYAGYPVPDSLAARGAMGGLGQIGHLDLTIADRLRLEGLAGLPTFNGVLGALWHDAAGNALRHERLCGLSYRRVPQPGQPGPGVARRGSVPQHNEWIPGRGMGDVEVLCGPPATPTATYTPRPTPSASATPTATTTATPTLTPPRWRIYLPSAVYVKCRDREVHADVVLVLDASTSMLRPTAAGRTKVAAAIDAAKAFVALMDFTPDAAGAQDQVAVVAFNDTAWIQAPLGSSPGELGAALNALPDRVAQGTRLDVALHRGAEALSSGARRHDNNPVLVLMTDGLPNRVPTPAAGGSQADTVLQAAAAAKAGGTAVYTIGVGNPDDPDPLAGIDARLLRRVASRPDMYYQAPDAEELESVYRAIAYTIACPPPGHALDEGGLGTYR